MLLTRDDHVVQALTTNRADQPLTVSIGLGWSVGGPQNLQPKTFKLRVTIGRENSVSVVNDKSIVVLPR